jgi:hypothetical protein
LTINAPRAQGASGNLKAAGPIQTSQFRIMSELDLAHIILVSLDKKPLQTSERILLQVMSEEKATGFESEPEPTGLKRIKQLGTDPWLVKNFSGTVECTRPDAAQLKVLALDFNGYPNGECGNASRIQLQPATVYYLIQR